jgi:hypothetical protein
MDAIGRTEETMDKYYTLFVDGARYRLPDGTLVQAHWNTAWASDHHWTLTPVDYPPGPDDGSDAYSIWLVYPSGIEREVPGDLAPTDMTVDDIRPAQSNT